VITVKIGFFAFEFLTGKPPKKMTSIISRTGAIVLGQINAGNRGTCPNTLEITSLVLRLVRLASRKTRKAKRRHNLIDDLQGLAEAVTKHVIHATPPRRIAAEFNRTPITPDIALGFMRPDNLKTLQGGVFNRPISIKRHNAPISHHRQGLTLRHEMALTNSQPVNMAERMSMNARFIGRPGLGNQGNREQFGGSFGRLKTSEIPTRGKKGRCN
jgi:hypothetical protein